MTGETSAWGTPEWKGKEEGGVQERTVGVTGYSQLCAEEGGVLALHAARNPPTALGISSRRTCPKRPGLLPRPPEPLQPLQATCEPPRALFARLRLTALTLPSPRKHHGLGRRLSPHPARLSRTLRPGRAPRPEPHSHRSGKQAAPPAPRSAGAAPTRAPAHLPPLLRGTPTARGADRPLQRPVPPTAQGFPAPRAGRGPGERVGGAGPPSPRRPAPPPAPRRRDAQSRRDPDRGHGGGDGGGDPRGFGRESAAAPLALGPVRRAWGSFQRGLPYVMEEAARTQDSSRARRSSADPSPLAEASAPGVRALAHRRAWAVVPTYLPGHSQRTFLLGLSCHLESSDELDLAPASQLLNMWQPQVSRGELIYARTSKHGSGILPGPHSHLLWLC
ncbi:hypothetical protein J1605_004593 [Eschrichtius robustus]|uniref:Uncharacterized protein n=1 Tax=Eschrichtius robustus TaxID=9764 RepID=A0AB34HIL0_ESCRO|nr:hypothetical protein J1605_004593 [Eschrichtius robustus]